MTEDDTYQRLVRPGFLEMTTIYNNNFDDSGLSEISKEDFFNIYYWDYKDWRDRYMDYIK